MILFTILIYVNRALGMVPLYLPTSGPLVMKRLVRMRHVNGLVIGALFVYKFEVSSCCQMTRALRNGYLNILLIHPIRRMYLFRLRNLN